MTGDSGDNLLKASLVVGVSLFISVFIGVVVFDLGVPAGTADP